ncbi:MAG: Na/Pi cotransporter family protein [Thiohalomonadaceae bacterium]
MLTALGAFLGGTGLFLLGMRLLTDGLKLAAGDTLRRILANATRTRLRGLVSGIFITALVQSSTSVTVAVLGFINAGLVNLGQVVTVIYGSNVGSTMIGWLVALVGFKIDVAAVSLPLVGLGMGLALTTGRRAALGQALAGFGVFLMGIGILSETFETLGQELPMELFNATGPLALLGFLAMGFLLTVLMQSSSASLAIVLTASAGGVLPFANAAAAVIGANVGTTSTAVLAAIGATANAKRAAAIHVSFNFITAGVAVLLFPVLIALVDASARAAGLSGGAPTELALFHSVFNVLGVAILWPFTPRLVAALEARFQEADAARPRHLDRTVVATPALAVDALALELARTGALARAMARGALSAETAPAAGLEEDKAAIDGLVEAMGAFGAQVVAGNQPAEVVEALPNALRVARYYTNIAELSLKISALRPRLAPVRDAALAARLTAFRALCARLVDLADPAEAGYDEATAAAVLGEMEAEYQALKAALLRAGANGLLPVREMVAELDVLSMTRRLIEQIVKSAPYLAGLLRPADPFRSTGAA